MSIKMEHYKRLNKILAPLKQIDLAEFSNLLDELPSSEEEEDLVDLYNKIADAIHKMD